MRTLGNLSSGLVWNLIRNTEKNKNVRKLYLYGNLARTAVLGKWIFGDQFSTFLIALIEVN